MNKKLVAFILFKMAISAIAFAQVDVQEDVYLHLNSRELMSGETLHFSAFCKSKSTNQPSPLSSILYVEMIGDSNKVFFQQKLKLNKGRGAGDFFVSSIIPTGSYQIIAYTRWMRNFGAYFNCSINVINPFELYKKPIESAELTIDARPEGQYLVENENNLIAVKIRPSKELKGRLVNGESEVKANFSISKNGLGSFQFIPTQSEDYRIILEDNDGELSFFDFDKKFAEMGVIQVRKKNENYQFRALGDTPSNARLVLTDGQNLFLNRPVSSNAVVSFNASEITPGVLKAMLLDNSGKEISSRLLFIPNERNQLANKTRRTFGKRSLIQWNIPVETSSNVSVSINKSSFTGEAPSTFDFEAFGNIVEDFSSIAHSQIDEALFFATWKYPKGMPINEEVKLLPEMIGSIVDGSISPKEKNILVQFNITGKDYHTNNSKTNEDGEFSILVEDIPENMGEAFLSLSDESLDVTYISPFIGGQKSFEFLPMQIDSSSIEDLKNRSIQIQIENAFHAFNEDSVILYNEWTPQFTTWDANYVLDDFNRFPTMKDHFIEYIPSTAVRKGKIKIKVTTSHLDAYEPLLLLDGLPVTSEAILSTNPYEIKSIKVIKSRIYINQLVADGLIVFESFNHDPIKLINNGKNRKIDFKYPDQSNVLGLNPNFLLTDSSFVPDYRYQLFWNPNLEINEVISSQIKFYTSDVSGMFEVVVEGYDKLGNPISSKEYFHVQD